METLKKIIIAILIVIAAVVFCIGANVVVEIIRHYIPKPWDLVIFLILAVFIVYQFIINEDDKEDNNNKVNE